MQYEWNKTKLSFAAVTHLDSDEKHWVIIASLYYTVDEVLA